MNMLEEKEISQAVISRLPRYYRYLQDLIDEGTERISSKELSERMHVTASQIRQDFNNFGGFGQQGYGYNVRYLHDEIGQILGLDQEHSMVLIGAGNLGQALVGYMNFKRRGFVFKAAFDCKPELYGKKVGQVVIRPMNELTGLIEQEKIEIAVLTVPKTAAMDIAKVLSGTCIRAIWNFAHVDLPVPERIQVENVHLSDSLMKLSYQIRSIDQADQEKAD